MTLEIIIFCFFVLVAAVSLYVLVSSDDLLMRGTSDLLTSIYIGSMLLAVALPDALITIPFLEAVDRLIPNPEHSLHSLVALMVIGGCLLLWLFAPFVIAVFLVDKSSVSSFKNFISLKRNRGK